MYHALHGVTRVLVKLHAELAAAGLVDPEPSFILFNRLWQRHVRAAYPSAPSMLHPTFVGLAGEAIAPDGAGAVAWADPFFERAWRNDRTVSRWSRFWALRLWRLTVQRAEQFIARQRPDVILTDTIQSLPCYAVFVCAARYGVPYVQFCGARLNEKRVEYHVDVSGMPQGIEMGSPSAEEGRQWAQRYISDMRTRTYAGPSYMSIYRGKRVRFKGSDLSKGFSYLLENLVYGGALECTNGDILAPLTSKFKAMAMARYIRDPRYYKSMEDVRALPGRKLLFPLHVTPEANTLTWAPRYADMAANVRNIAQALPAGWTLVVKEHPSVTSVHRERAEIERMARQPRALLVAPAVPNAELLDICDATITVNSTFGMEVMLMGKPLITLGRPFYDMTGNTIPCGDLADLPACIDRVMHLRTDAGRNEQFIAAYRAATCPAVYANPDIVYADLAVDPENVRALAGYVAATVLPRVDDLRNSITAGELDLGVAEPVPTMEEA